MRPVPVSKVREVSPLTDPQNRTWLDSYLATLGERLDLLGVLNFGMGVEIAGSDEDDAYYDLLEWLDETRLVLLSEWLSANSSVPVAWVAAAAIACAWTWWEPVIAADANQDFAAVMERVSPILELAETGVAAESDSVPRAAMPPKGLAYVGHFYGALHAFHDASQTGSISRFCESIVFARVRPSEEDRYHPMGPSLIAAAIEALVG